MDIRGWRCWNGWLNLTSGPIVQIWTERSRSTWMERTSLFASQIADVDLGSLQGVWGPAIFFNHLPCLVRILRAHQNDGAAHSRQDVLRCIQGGYVAIDSCGFQQAANYQGFRLLFSIEDPHQFLVRIWTLLFVCGTSFWHRFSSKLR